MPYYCYTSEDADVTIEEYYPVGKAPKTVTRGDDLFYRDIPAEWRGRKDTSSCWPMKSDALGVLPNQVGEATQELADAGVPTSFAKDGRVILESRGHRKKVCEALGYHDKNAGYGDRAKP